MTDETPMHEAHLRRRFQTESDEYLDRVVLTRGLGSDQGRIANSILTQRRIELRRSARIIAWATVVIAVAAVAAAIAAWTAVVFSLHQLHTAPNEQRQSAVTPHHK